MCLSLWVHEQSFELPNKECFFSSTKKEKISDDGKKLDT